MYKTLEAIHGQEKHKVGLLGEERPESGSEEGEITFYLEGLASGTQFRKAQRQHPTFQAIWETEIVKRDQQIIRLELCENLPHCEVRNGLLCC